MNRFIISNNQKYDLVFFTPCIWLLSLNKMLAWFLLDLLQAPLQWEYLRKKRSVILVAGERDLYFTWGYE